MAVGLDVRISNEARVCGPGDATGAAGRWAAVEAGLGRPGLG